MSSVVTKVKTSYTGATDREGAYVTVVAVVDQGIKSYRVPINYKFAGQELHARSIIGVLDVEYDKLQVVKEMPRGWEWKVNP